MHPSEIALQQSQGTSSTLIHKIALEILIAKTDKQLSHLDIGCGKGEFLNLLAKNSYKNLSGCDGYDYTSNTKQTSNYSFQKVNLNEKLPYPSNSFASISALEVIEHLENPRAFLREVIRVLSPNGYFVLSTPNNESITSLLSLLFRGYHSAFANACYPAHISALLQIDLDRIFKENNFTSIHFAWSEQGRMPCMNLCWQNIIPFAARGKRFSDTIFAFARKG